MSDDYLDFDKVLNELEIEEAELKKLVSAGEIKAFREADQMKFKKEDIDRLKHDKASEPDVIELLDSDEDLEAETAPTLDSDEIDFDNDEFSGDIDLSTTEISDDDLLGDDEGDADDEEVDLGSIDMDEEEETLLDEDAGASPRRSGRLVKKTKIAGMGEEEDEEAEPQWALGLMIVSAIILILCTIVMVDVATGSASPVVEWLVDIFA